MVQFLAMTIHNLSNGKRFLNWPSFYHIKIHNFTSPTPHHHLSDIVFLNKLPSTDLVSSFISTISSCFSLRWWGWTSKLNGWITQKCIGLVSSLWRISTHVLSAYGQWPVLACVLGLTLNFDVTYVYV